MRRLPAILLLIGFAALGSGLLDDLHVRTHAMEHAAAHDHAATESPAHDGGEDDGCGLCAHLQVPRISPGYLPVLICLGLFVAFLTQLSPRLAPQRVAARVDCRGPPPL